MSQALYRKWRPARFDQVIGQEHITQTIKNSVAAERIGHAYLFCGPRGTGKTTSARLLAKAVNCLHEVIEERPCDNCHVCHAINENRFLDLIEIDAASNTGVDDIRDLRDKINFAPNEGRFKVYIIDEVHMLSTAAFNALLKTLEEPPPHAKFVLATTEEHKVPLTIKSRCQQFNFRLLTTQEIIGRLEWLLQQEEVTVEPGVLQLVAQHGAGSLRDSESLLDQLVGGPGETITVLKTQAVLGTAASESVFELTEAILNRDGAQGLQIIQEALNTGADARQFARQLVIYLRQLLLLHTAPTIQFDLSPDLQAKIGEQAKKVNRQLLISAIKRFSEAATQASSSWQSQLPLELAFIESLPAEKLQERVQIEEIEMGQPVAAAPAQVPAAPSAAVAPAQTAAPAAKTPPPIQETPQTAAPPPAEPKTMPATPASQPAAAAFSLADIKGKAWRELKAKSAEKNRNYKNWLNSSQPIGVEGNTLILGFDLPFLRDKLAAHEPTISAILSDIIGSESRVKCVLKSDYNAPQQSTSSSKTMREEVEELASELGGVVSDID